MGYINKDLILSGLNLRLIRLKSEHESEGKITELENVIGAIEETETDDVVEHSKIDKAIEEIEEYSFKHCFEHGQFEGEELEIIRLEHVIKVLKEI